MQKIINKLKKENSFIEKIDFSIEMVKITYKEGYVNTEYWTYKKLMEQCLFIAKKFPNIQSLKLLIPSKKQEITESGLAEEKRMYSIDITISELELFFGLPILEINNFEMLLDKMEMNNKQLVTQFAKEFVKSELI
jgi:hypothetical protein